MRNQMWIAAMMMAGAMCVAMVECQAQQIQQPKVTHAQMSVKAGDNLQREIAATQTSTWIGYAVATTHRVDSGWDGVEYLEGTNTEDMQTMRDSRPIPPAAILLRVTSGKVERIQIESLDRDIDAGGLPFVWLTGVSPADSVKTLKSVVEASMAEAAKAAANPPVPVSTGDRERDRIERDVQREPARKLQRIEDRGLTAIAIESCPEATAALKQFTAASYAEPMREKAAFWLANERGAEGLQTVTALLKSDNDEAFRVKLVFDLTLVKGDSQKAAVDELIALAKADTMPKVRTQAQFWLAQMVGKKDQNDPRIVRTLSDAANNDPEAGIRKSAVFALSRLPVEQAVPELIQVASTTKDATTRKEAIFWLGRSKDPRALDYLVKVVKGN
jgi:HEAT repeat protein